MTIFVIFWNFFRIFGAKPEMGRFCNFFVFFRISRLEGFLYSVAPQGDRKGRTHGIVDSLACARFSFPLSMPGGHHAISSCLLQGAEPWAEKKVSCGRHRHTRVSARSSSSPLLHSLSAVCEIH